MYASPSAPSTRTVEPELWITGWAPPGVTTSFTDDAGTPLEVTLVSTSVAVLSEGFRSLTPAGVAPAASLETDRPHAGSREALRVVVVERHDDVAVVLGDRVGDLRGGDGAEQATALAGADLHVDRVGLELGLDVLGVVLVAHRAGGAGRLDRLDGLLAAAAPADAEATGDEVVAAVAVLDLDHVAGGAESVDLLGQDELHVFSSLPQRPVDV